MLTPDSAAFTPVTKKSEISKAISQLHAAVRQSAKGVEYESVVGAPGGAGQSRITWLKDLAFWICIERYEQRGDRHWIAYGLENPGETNRALNIRVESSLPSAGQDRRIAGLVACDASGSLYLLHSGKIGGGKKGFGKTFFWERYKGERVSVAFDDGVREYALIGRIGARDFLRRLADFVHGVNAIRENDGTYIWRFPQSTRKFVKKNGSKSEVYFLSDTIVQDHKHDRVLNSLKIQVVKLFKNAIIQEDQRRDMLVKIPRYRTIEIEAKTSLSPQDIYTAVGQLLVNRDSAGESRLILVAPSEIETATELLDRLDSLSVGVLGYVEKAGAIEFPRLAEVLHR